MKYPTTWRAGLSARTAGPAAASGTATATAVMAATAAAKRLFIGFPPEPRSQVVSTTWRTAAASHAGFGLSIAVQSGQNTRHADLPRCGKLVLPGLDQNAC